MSTATIFTTAVSMKAVEFCTAGANVSIADQLAAGWSTLPQQDRVRSCVISRFEDVVEGIALRVCRGNKARTAHRQFWV
jgi:hypothetical protein